MEHSPSGRRIRNEERLASVYEVVAARRNHSDGLMWQVPALSITAQAFLLNAAVSANTARGVRIGLAGLSTIAAFLAAQLMAKHRLHARLDDKWLEHFERGVLQGVDAVKVSDGSETLWIPHSKPDYRTAWPLLRVPSSRLWLAGLVLFGLASFTVFIVAIVWPTALVAATP